MLNPVRKHYAVQYHAAYSTQALYSHYAVQYHAAYSSIMPFNIIMHYAVQYQLHAVKHYAIQYHTVSKHYAIQYQ